MDASISSSSDDMSRTMKATPAVVDAEALVSAMNGRLDVLPEKVKIEPYTFSRVPAYIRETNKKLYEPMVIAIGPYHHGRKHLQTMENHKWRYLRDLLFRARPTRARLEEDCLKLMIGMEERARRCYRESIDLAKDEFVQMMVLDACFIIEFCWKLHDGHGTLSDMDWWALEYTPMDLLLLENQIPFFIINELFQFVFSDAQPPSLESLLYESMKTIFAEMQGPISQAPTEIHHLLHLCYHSFVPTEVGRSSESHRGALESNRLAAYILPCATELHEVGVSFRKKRLPRHMLDITFQNGVMEIPSIQMEDFTKPLFTNLVAFEQSICDGPRNMTSFSLLIDKLINTKKDVAMLQKCDVIHNLLGSEEEVAVFFNQLCEYTTYGEDHYFSELFREVNSYRDYKWHSYRARLVHDHLNNPWTILSVAAALILLILTFLQTFFGMYSYFHPR